MLSLGCPHCYGVWLAALVVILFFVIIYATSERYPKISRDKSEKFFLDCRTKTKEAFPSLQDPWSVHLSVIIPAYNEEQRLPPMLDECLGYLEERSKSGLTYEVIVVSDGSTDKTVDLAHSYASRYNTLRVLNLVTNRGKGGAVRLGMLSARGSALLFADADGATKFNDLKKLDESLTNVLGFDYTSEPEKTASSDAVICGSRAHLEKEETAKRTYFRLLLMYGFHFLVWLLCVRGIRDTQCGFKLLTRKSARTIFEALHVERWAFDVEMLYIAQTLNIPVTEIAVNWTEIEGSKIIPFWSWLQMGRDLFFIWLRYTIGAWRINKPKTT
ncbi:PREDICTED: dolichyl-phosphate beta-glucosyltransferase [Vollenhovia emeryi]|uniref:dolichyl-phosphate beta-glucosyltransferase n=1 Tax=Vollenhovia emeryi TaxID=411798 RepID=UPI0005F3DACD|nr:PREDICTED: dolichyl-phosphate beta-glucosyltransferase [Vollenhovia emeryi]